MSDELWVSRGESGYGSVVPGTGLPGALLQLLRTSGLVACYLPYRDVYGRNVSKYTTQPSEFLGLTRSGATYMETVDTGSHACNIDLTETNTTYHYHVKITPIGRKRFLLGHGARNSWAIFDTSSVSVIATGSDATNARITANGDGTFDLSTGIVSGYQYPALYTMPDDATSPVERSFAGDTNKGFTLHEWQVNFGLTLYPYSPPVGLSQTLIDRSPQGNHAQLGSTSGEDTNDPSWGTNALTFGGDDYVRKQITFADGDFSLIFGINISSETTTYQPILSIGTAWNRWYGVRTGSAGNKLYPYIHTADGGSGDGVTVTLSGDNILQLDKNGGALTLYANNTVVSSVAISTPLGYTTPKLTLGANPIGAGTLRGSIYGVMLINRLLSGAERALKYANLKTLLAGQGVTIA